MIDLLVLVLLFLILILILLRARLLLNLLLPPLFAMVASVLQKFYDECHVSKDHSEPLLCSKEASKIIAGQHEASHLTHLVVV
jgi:hypothetical protein